MVLPVFSEWQQICWVIKLGDGANVCIKTSHYSLGAGKWNGSFWLRINKTQRDMINRVLHKNLSKMKSC